MQFRDLNAFPFDRTGFRLKSNCQRVEELLRKLCSEIKAKFVGKNGISYITSLSLRKAKVQEDNWES